jgi:hypothetical protein
MRASVYHVQVNALFFEDPDRLKLEIVHFS